MTSIKKVFSLAIICIAFISCAQNDAKNNNQPIKITNQLKTNEMTQETNWNPLTDEEARVIIHKGTERPNIGEFVHNHADGTYSCKRCNSPLFKSDTKFDSGCGWPSFDNALEGAVVEVPDADGSRTEIVCSNCKGHLGHVFKGEGFTDTSVRHCVNSISMNFESVNDLTENVDVDSTTYETAIFASGCFWGTEYFFEKAEGVISTQVGYIGGDVDNVTYRQICTGTTGHAEAVKVIFDPTKTDFKTMCILFFETHNPEQVNGQGVDLGTQYRSGVFYTNETQKEITEELISTLETKNGLTIATEVTEASTFWEGEDYHEHYYSTKNALPTCHGYHKLFED